jgi:hypothetical protein
LAGGGAVLRVLKTVGHRGTETQRKAREVKTISGFLAFDFLCASVPLWLMVFSWGSGCFGASVRLRRVFTPITVLKG